MLGDLGAEIIKVEAPGKPDPIRDWGKARYEGRSLWWPVQSRNKKCITLDLRQPRGQELLLRLVEHADVVTENFRPGTLERWGVGYDRMSEVNPRVILARVSGYGQTGPYAERAGFASVSEAMGGLRHVNGYPGEAPPRMHLSLGDSLAGMFAAQGILAAIYWRDVAGGGLGQVVDVSLMEASFAMLESTVPEYDRLGIVRGPQGTNLKGIAPEQHLQVARRQVDGDRRERRQRLPPALRGDGAGRSWPTTSASRPTSRVATTRTRSRGSSPTGRASATRAEIDRILNEAGVICGPIYTIADIFEDPQFKARDMLLEHVDPEFGPYIGPGDRPEADAHARAPCAGRRPWEEGSHNDEIYGGLLGLAEDERASLREEGVI